MNVSLPIDARLPEIVSAVRDRGALVLVAEPGAGKTTRAPRALLEHGLAEPGEILVLEPRRLATRLAAARVAEELGEKLGQRVGYTIRFEDVGGKDTRLRFVTEAVLTRRLVRDPELRGVSCVVLDELHERSLHADLALAFVRRLRETARPDLKVLAMSATIDAERFAGFLGADVIAVSGRRFDVAIEHLPQKDDRPLEDQVRAAVRRLVLASGPGETPLDGHVLVFLPGAAEIRRCAAALEETARSHDLEVLPLHGDLPPEEQDRAVRASKRRKVILSTNVAETSITIDGVVAVIDSGLERAASFSPWSGVGELVTAPICQASATQRAGRAGRTRPGRAIRLYTQHDHDGRPAFLKPEIQRVDFAETRLLLARMGVTDARSFPFFEAPSLASIDRAETTLRKLGAIDAGGAITDVGRALVELPVHPRLARVAYEAARTGHRERGARLAALLGEKEIRLSLRTRFGPDADRHAASGPSDALARLEAFEAAASRGLSAGRARAHDLDVGATLAAGRTAEQLARQLARTRIDEAPIFDEDEALLRALLAGYPDRVGKRRKERGADVVLAGGGSARLAETSVVRDAPWVVVIEAEERRGAVECRVASQIEPEWLLELFPDRVRDVQEIRFDRDKERIERVTALEYEGLLLDESRSDAAGAPGAAAVLAKAAMAAGISRFLDVHALDQWKLRLALAHRVDPSVPLLDDARVFEALAQAAEGRRSLKELEGAGVLDAITSSLGAGVLAKLDRLAPTHVKLPGRAKVPVTYEHDRPPWIESRMQDFFGLADGPSAGGAPIVLHLLAPNHRAVQVTTDLAGFWQRHYPALRKQLSREYPKHFWPEDPRNAEPPPPRGPRRG
ncbi:MAG: ATP-dependent helicase HrpB [Sandaracinaceae bacterium]